MLQVDEDAIDIAAVHEKCDAIETLWIADGHVVMLFKLLRAVTRPKNSWVVAKSIYCHELRKICTVLRIDEITSGERWATVR